MELHEMLQSGKKACGTMLRILRTPAGCLLAKNAGLDFFMLDCEQNAFDFESMHDMFVAARLAGIAGLLRVPMMNKEWISRSLDCGASGLMVPMVETEEEAREVAWLAKYPPVGNRGYAAGGPKNLYMTPKGPVEEMERHNRAVVVIAQIETCLGVENARGIAGVEGIDALLIGPNDLSIALGVPGDIMNPVELEAIAKVAAVCRTAGKGFGIHAGTKLIELFIDDVNIVMMRDDSDIVASGFKDIRSVFSRITGGMQ